ncbi:hypothetical protein BLNAU_15252 [Blattamonas nauphoetae]|uniref:Uncharacterized protein n=1 Tax=Blattamonas nauphoetae TaxID=2049346 RepID=A0ABQ9XGU1_9EUKA|nr:hypothetical protein BLNAU_15252 [Blattamonas nauphoetae]
MEWFVCSVIELKSKVSEWNGSFWFDWDDVVVDGFGTARIKLSASHSDSSPPHSPQSFSDCIASLSKLFLHVIDQLYDSDCLQKSIEQHSRENVLLNVIFDLISYLNNKGCVFPVCCQDEFRCSVEELTLMYMKVVPEDLDLSTDLVWMVEGAYQVVHIMETVGIVENEDRLTDPENDPRSPEFSYFLDLINSELERICKRYDPDLFKEARRISSWKELLQKVASGEEVEVCLAFLDFDFQNDTSFLKLPFFRPTLLSLQAKIQKLASSLDGSAYSSMLSPHSSHSSPNTSLESHLDSSLRTHSSSPHFKQESIQLLTILHSLLTSPLSPSRSEHSLPYISSDTFASLQNEPVNPEEIFHSSIFDEVDNEKLARSLFRCRSVYRLVGAEKCILDIPNFIDRNVSALNTSDSLIRTAALFLIQDLVCAPCVHPLFPRLWYGLHAAFRDGRPEEQFVLVWMSMFWIGDTMNNCSLPPYPAAEFDWDGLISAELNDIDTFVISIRMLESLRHYSIDDLIGTAELITLQ